MKTKLYFLTTIVFSLFSTAQNVTIPDSIFKSYLVNNSSINTNGDSQIQVSEALAFTGTIDCSSRNIASLTGIEAFVNITQLSCFSNLLTSLDVTKNTSLKILVCAGNQLTSLDVSKNLALTELNFHTNKLTNVDVSNNTLLNRLAFANNLITTINLTKNTALLSLVCENNILTELDLSKNKLLTDLDCSNNRLTTLDLKNNAALAQLSLNSNLLTNLDLTGNSQLSILNSNGNNLQNIDLRENTLLLLIDLSSNKLKGLDIVKSKNVEFLDIHNNELTSVNVKNGNNAGIMYLDTTGNSNLDCIQVDNISEANGYTTSGFWIKESSSAYNVDCNSTLSSNDLSNDHLKIYPNPTKNILNWNGVRNLEIYNTAGQKVMTEKKISSANLSNLSNGIYIVILSDENGKETQRSKIIKN